MSGRDARVPNRVSSSFSHPRHDQALEESYTRTAPARTILPRHPCPVPIGGNIDGIEHEHDATVPAPLGDAEYVRCVVVAAAFFPRPFFSPRLIALVVHRTIEVTITAGMFGYRRCSGRSPSDILFPF